MITRENVLHVAKLARLELAEAEIERLIKDLAQILGYVEKLSELDTTSVPPTGHVGVARAPLGPDEVQPGLSPEQALGEAPRQAGGGFAVPAFVDES
jgi:aspartyl-tRNA(Asn)/glutamyl-tRNA(Gln) amidotransferase subunit C